MASIEDTLILKSNYLLCMIAFSDADTIGNFVRDTVLALVVLLGLYGLGAAVQIPPFQLPAYVLSIWFTPVENGFETIGVNFDGLIVVFLLGLSIVSGIFTYVFRRYSYPESLSNWRIGVGGGITVFGSLSVLYALSALLSASYLPLALVFGSIGVFSLLMASRLMGVVGTT